MEICMPSFGAVAGLLLMRVETISMFSFDFPNLCVHTHAVNPVTWLFTSTCSPYYESPLFSKSNPSWL
jgi:hypothetical protein